MTRLETGLLDLAESLLRNDDVVHDADYQTIYSIATDVGEVESENAKLRELVNGMWYCAHEAHGMCARVPFGGKRPFTCCPLYDFDAKEYRCKKLIRELFGKDEDDGCDLV